MNNTPSLNEINKTANMNTNLLTRHNKIKFHVYQVSESENETISHSRSIKFIFFYYTKIQKRYKYAFTIQN